MSGLKGIQKTGGRSNEGSKTVDVPLVAMDFKWAGEAQSKTPNKADVMVAGLLCDAFGMKAEFDAAGNPTTLVDVRLNYFENNEKMRKRVKPEARANIRDFFVGKDGKDKVKPGAGYVMTAEGCYYDARAKQVVSRYLTRASQAVNSDTFRVLVNEVMSVRRPGQQARDDGSMNRWQSRVVPFVGAGQTYALSGQEAFQANPVEHLREALATVLGQLGSEEAGLIGSSGFMLRVVGFEDGDLVAHRWEGRPIWDNDAKAHKSAAESVDAFLARDDVQQILPILKNTKADEDTFWEIIPFQSIRTGLRSNPYSRNEDRVAEKKKELPIESLSDHTSYTYVDGDGDEQIGFAASTLYARRSFDEMKNDYNPWFSSKTHPTEGFNPRIYGAAELITGALPEKFANAIEDAVTARCKAVQDGVDARRGAKEEVEKAPSEDIGADEAPSEDARVGANF